MIFVACALNSTNQYVNKLHSAANLHMRNNPLLLPQSQSITVDRQMRRYDVPRLAFINKCDRSGADPIRVLNQMRDKLKLNCSPVQLPLGIEDKLKGLVDVVEERAYSFGGPFGNEITEVSCHLDVVSVPVLSCVWEADMFVACAFSGL